MLPFAIQKDSIAKFSKIENFMYRCSVFNILNAQYLGGDEKLKFVVTAKNTR